MAKTLSKLSEKCKACTRVDKCDHKRMELCALAELPPKMCTDAGQIASVSAVMPIMRERIKSPLSPFVYKDELEKALNDYHFGCIFMNGA